LAGPGLLAQVAVSKYGDHLPLHRVYEIKVGFGFLA
jgi:transposase